MADDIGFTRAERDALMSRIDAVLEATDGRDIPTRATIIGLAELGKELLWEGKRVEALLVAGFATDGYNLMRLAEMVGRDMAIVVTEVAKQTKAGTPTFAIPVHVNPN